MTILEKKGSISQQDLINLQNNLNCKIGNLTFHSKIQSDRIKGKAFSMPLTYKGNLYLLVSFDNKIQQNEFMEYFNKYFFIYTIKKLETDIFRVKSILIAIDIKDIALDESSISTRNDILNKTTFNQDASVSINDFFTKTILHTSNLAKEVLSDEQKNSLNNSCYSLSMLSKNSKPPVINYTSKYKKTINKLIEGILTLSKTNTNIPPSLWNHPSLEKVSFLYDASMVAIFLKAAGKQDKAEKILDYFHNIFKITPEIMRKNKDAQNTYGVLKVFESHKGTYHKAVLNAFRTDSLKFPGKGILEFYTTPGPNSFLYFAMSYVNKQKYLSSLKQIASLLKEMQNDEGAILDGDRLADKVHTEPHCDAIIALLMDYNVDYNITPWPKEAEKGYKWFINTVFNPEKGEIYQGITTDKYFATDGYTWTMASPFGDRLAKEYGIEILKKLSLTLLHNSLVKITWTPPNSKEITQTLFDFTNPTQKQILEPVVWNELHKNYGITRGEYHPIGSAEWTGGAILGFQKNAVRAWNAGEKELAIWFKNLAVALTHEVFKSYYTVNGIKVGAYATGQNIPNGHGWISPIFNVPGKVKGGAPISAWPILTEIGVNPFILNDNYKETFDKIPSHSLEEAEKILQKELRIPPFKETPLNKIPKSYPTLREPRFYIAKMWEEFNKKNYKQAQNYALEVITEPKWKKDALKENKLKSKRLGGLVDYPWGISFLLNNDYRQTEIWKYPLLNEYGAALWMMVMSNVKHDKYEEAKKWMKEFINNFPLAQIASGKNSFSSLYEKQYNYFKINGYINPLLSWKYNPSNKEDDNTMQRLYNEIIEEWSQKKDFNEEAIIPPYIILDAPENDMDVDLKYKVKTTKEILYEGHPPVIENNYKWNFSLLTKTFRQPVIIRKGQTLSFDYTAINSKHLTIRLLTRNNLMNFKENIFFKDLKQSQGTIFIKIKKTMNLSRIQLILGDKTFSNPKNKETHFVLNSIKLYSYESNKEIPMKEEPSLNELAKSIFKF